MSIQKNTIYNLLGSIIPLAVSLITIPIYLDLVGESRYGILAITWLLLGYFGLFDLGLGRATAQSIAAHGSSSGKERANIFWTALILNLGLGIIGGLLIWPVTAYFFGYVFNIDELFYPEIQAAVPWLILAVPIATLSGVLVGSLQGMERFYELNLISVSGTILFQIFPLAVAAFWSTDLNLLIPAAILSRVLTIILLFIYCKKYIILTYPLFFERHHSKHLVRFGGWVTITSFVGPMMVILDRFIIGAISSAKAVSYYTVPFQLGERSTIISHALVSALFPRFATVSHTEEYRLATEGLRLLVSVMTPLVAIGILFVEPFLAWWISQEFANQSALIGQILLFGFWFNNFAKIPSVQLQARGSPDIVAKCHLVEVLPYLGLLYLGVSQFGAIGAAVVFSLRVVVDFILLSKFAGVLSFSLRLMFFPLIMLLLAFLIAVNTKFSQQEWLILMVIHLLFTTILAWRQLPISSQKMVSKRVEKLLVFPSKL